jgi:hypothetical protein
MFWSTPFITYAAEARPYGPLIGFFGLTLLAYGAAGGSPRPRWSVPCLALGNIGMMLCHVLAPLSILPFWVAEIVRSIMRRRIDWPVQGAFLAAAPFALLYLPALSLQRKVWYPLPLHASPAQAAYFFIRLGVFFAFPGLFAAIAAAFVVAWATRPFSPAERRNPGGPAALAWSLCLLALPVAVNLLLMRNAAAFWDRYCITTAFGFYILAAVMLARFTGFRRNSAIAALLALSAASLLAHYGSDSQAPYSTAAIRADLPLVAGDGLTFLEMDHYDTGGVQSRLYYLVDEAAALRFSHSNIFESMPMLTGYFPIRSRVSPYSAFVEAHPHFLVLSRPDYLEEWVLPKLRSDGAEIRRVQSVPAPNRAFDLYEVRLVR